MVWLNPIDDLLNISDWNTNSTIADDVANEIGRPIDSNTSNWDRGGDEDGGFGW